ncbi:MAG: hypothetical protein AMS24_04735 [Chlamydiae bacterium SM23_39]|nr:MAG: hypothetical protein AMS24_04735 [Chlamydiae bacterium SM23_39]
MIGRIIFWTIFFLIIGGVIIHFQWNSSVLLKWIGNLPGDFILKMRDKIIYFPISSALLLSSSISLILSLIFKKEE